MAAPSNVIRLPTAAPRKVEQRSIRAVRAYKAANPWPGEYIWPARREAMAQVQRADGIPERLALIAVMSTLTPEQKRAAQDAVHCLHFRAGDDLSLVASAIIAGIK